LSGDIAKRTSIIPLPNAGDCSAAAQNGQDAARLQILLKIQIVASDPCY
jgi:hypothetical protein